MFEPFSQSFNILHITDTKCGMIGIMYTIDIYNMFKLKFKLNFQNMRLRPTEHLENRKMHTQERQLTHFLYFTTDLQRKPNRLFFSKPNWNRNRTKPAFFLETEPNLKNPFRTSLFCNFCCVDAVMFVH